MQDKDIIRFQFAISIEKLAFFTLDNQKYMFLVFPCGPNNALGFYSNMMNNFKDKWDVLFIEILRKIGTLIN